MNIPTWNGIVLLVCSMPAFLVAELEKRTPFNIPLAEVTPYFHGDSEKLDEVFISYGNPHVGWAISELNDRYVEDTRRRRFDHIHREDPRFAHLLTAFEAEQIDRVCKTFVETIEIFERDLKRERWGRCLYLDPYLARFLWGFYYLITAAYNSRDVLPEGARVSKDLFDEEMLSPKSDTRIREWRGNTDHIMKLRIASKALIHEIERWRVRELKNPQRDKWNPSVRQFGKTYELFVKLYFNMKDRGMPRR